MKGMNDFRPGAVRLFAVLCIAALWAFNTANANLPPNPAKGKQRYHQAEQAYQQSRLPKAIRLAKRSAQYYDSVDDQANFLKSKLRQIFYLIRYDRRYDYQELIDQTLALGKQYKDTHPQLYLKSLLYKAWFHTVASSGLKDYQRSLTIANRCLAYQRQVDDTYPKLMVRALLIKSSATDKSKGTFPPFVQEAYNKAKDWKQADKLELKSDVYHEYGNYLETKRKIDSAILLHQQAIEMLSNTYVNHHHRIFRYSLALIDIARNQDDFQMLKRFCDRAYEVVKANDLTNTKRAVAILANLASLEMNQHRYYKAKRYLDQALAIIRYHYQSYNTNNYYFRTHAQLAKCHLRLDNNQKAVNICKTAIKKIQTKEKTPTILKLTNALAFFLGSAYKACKKYDSSFKYLNKTLAFNEKYGDPLTTGSILINLALLHKDQKAYDTAIRYLRRAEPLYRKFRGKQSWQYATYITGNLAVCHLGNKDYEKARQLAQKGLMRNAVGFHDTHTMAFPQPSAVKNQEVAYGLALRKARAFKGQYQSTKNLGSLKKALYCYQQTDKYLQQLRIDNIMGDNPLNLAKLTNKLYPEVIKVCYQLQESGALSSDSIAKMAYAFSGKNRGFVLAGEMAKYQLTQSEHLPDSFTVQLNRLNQTIGAYTDSAQNARNPQKQAQHREQRFQHVKAKHQWYQKLKAQYPDYYRQHFKRELVPLNQLRNQLAKASKNLVSYVMGDDFMLAVVHTPDHTQIIKLPGKANLTPQIKALRQQMLKQARSYDEALAHRLYNKLFKPVEPALSSDQVVIIPDGVVGYLSFDMLLKDSATQKNLKDYPFLLKAYTLSYAPSASLWASGDQPVKNTGERRLAINAYAPDFDGEAEQVVASWAPGADTFRNALMQIPGAQAELAAIQDYWEARTYSDNKATESQFRKWGPKSRVIHLATHGVINNHNPAYSKLYFAKDSTSPEDGTLHNYEIYNMNLNADLAVLSACRTGVGKIQDGEGIMSLARGFQIAGCKNVMMTLWPVEDRTSAELMKKFYKHLSEGVPKAEALRQAKLAFLRSHNNVGGNPFYWSGYVLMGSDTRIQKPSGANHKWWWLAGIGGLGIVSIGLTWYFKQKWAW